MKMQKIKTLARINDLPSEAIAKQVLAAAEKKNVPWIEDVKNILREAATTTNITEITRNGATVIANRLYVEDKKNQLERLRRDCLKTSEGYIGLNEETRRGPAAYIKNNPHISEGVRQLYKLRK